MATLNIKGFPDGLHRKLKARAKRNRRSVAQEVTQILADSIGAPKPLSVLELRGPAGEHPDPRPSPELPADGSIG